jgi:hypothetical protein
MTCKPGTGVDMHCYMYNSALLPVHPRLRAVWKHVAHLRAVWKRSCFCLHPLPLFFLSSFLCSAATPGLMAQFATLPSLCATRPLLIVAQYALLLRHVRSRSTMYGELMRELGVRGGGRGVLGCLVTLVLWDVLTYGHVPTVPCVTCVTYPRPPLV